MTKLLVINSSPMGDHSITRKLTASFAEKYSKANPGTVVDEIDVTQLDLPHLDGEILGAFFTPQDQRNDEQMAYVQRSDELIAQFKKADAIVFGAPMHNFGIPSSLKAYVDHIARAGETFKYTDTGPVGLVEEKPVYVISARGGDYSEKGYPQLDFVLPYMQAVMGFLGLNRTTLIQANGIAMGEEAVAAAIAGAEADMDAALAA
ncbi:NAD(P)H-dependent oxidoreductase [Terasakiella sp. SH-1]|uniref:FMN-dependent NADH-azoreductase n=1 Tax=Terasakiella sp. SH-1 TaxID=2560057 RepID=UPI0010736F61|nr:NAD(P)H-dependent oxidoreductase [Terasakiella sp. SH-1]